MKEFLEKTLRQNVFMEETEYLNDKMPLAFRGRYTVFKIETNGLAWIAIQPKKDVGLVMLRKDRARIEKIAGLNCAIFLNATTFYIKEKLMEEGIPFVLNGKQVYLPFIGFLLSNSNERDIAPVHLISFLTQKLIFVAIYEKWQMVTVSEAAAKLEVSKMSVSRCFDEIEYLTYAVTKREIAGVGVKKMKQVHPGEEIGCVVLELGYYIDFKNKALEDPMSVALSLTEIEKQDERVNKSTNEMLKEYVW